MSNLVEPKLINPTFVIDYPKAIKISGIAHANNRMMCPHDCTGPIVWIANLHISLGMNGMFLNELHHHP